MLKICKTVKLWRTFNVQKTRLDVLPSSIVQRQALSAIARTGFTMAKLGSGGTTGGGGLYGDGRAPRVKLCLRKPQQKDAKGETDSEALGKMSKETFQNSMLEGFFVGILIVVSWCNYAADRGSKGMMIWYYDNILQEKQIDSIGKWNDSIGKWNALASTASIGSKRPILKRSLLGTHRFK